MENQTNNSQSQTITVENQNQQITSIPDTSSGDVQLPPKPPQRKLSLEAHNWRAMKSGASLEVIKKIISENDSSDNKLVSK